jgi:hypothetical protein
VFEHTRLEWQEGDRRLRELDSARRAACERAADRILEELRRRLGSRFSADELVRLYDGSQAWTMPLAVSVAPEVPIAWEQWVADAAFHRYLRDASDWPVSSS